jgi:DNA helicase-2/ATP-dependent DNA helicase PcrA
VPKRGLGDSTWQKLTDFANAHQIRLCSRWSPAASQVPDLTPRFVNKLEQLGQTLFELMGQVDQIPVEDLIEAVM